MEPKVSKRIEAIAGMVPEGSVVCDIGCDHALLPIYLVKSGIITSAIAMDVVEGPLESAGENIKKYGLSDKITTRLSDGFDSLGAHEANCIVIAGMGGRLMLDILQRGEHVWSVADTLILSPHRDERTVREYMAARTRYDDDMFLKDAGEYYTVMRFKVKESPVALDIRQSLFGLNPTADYILHRKKVYSSVLQSLNRAKPTEENIKKKKETEYELEILEGIE